ncbi:hypothetical protein AJ78_02869 [Emergomyces pasteurianus Ep9510]|uniref:A to I editase domain-containing protein n=1 Tax=Emergomyces pasteurianus Ep9510 TaxID=1447872 RepID=A0A1J9PKQ0_9EURO|nr:hypothetical protein AJ78_02869 [Emergomyces pasteurianus Ep9510]
MGEASLESRIARLVHSHFDALPKRSKPTIHPNGSREWVPLSGIVLVIGEDTPNETLTCVAIATGAKCLPSTQINQCQGLVLHDSHAEILAIRAFNHWLLEECKSILDQRKDPRNHEVESASIGTNDTNDKDETGTNPTHEVGEFAKQASAFIYWRHQPETGKELASCNVSNISDINHIPKAKLSWPPFELHKDLKIYMYGTCAPCGDASMELCMASQEDPTPWSTPSLKGNNNSESSSGMSNSDSNQANNPHAIKNLLNGRAHFSILGAVRRKPSRADAESTLSKSCSDKLAVKQVTSLLAFPACLLIAPGSSVYLSALLLPEEEISRVACARAFGGGETGRLRAINERVWSDSDDGNTASLGGPVEYSFHPFAVRPVPSPQVRGEWAFGKLTDEDGEMKRKRKSANISAVWTAAPSSTAMNGQHRKPITTTANLNETLINGVKQGYHLSSPTPRKASALSRAKMWALLKDIVQLLPSTDDCGMNNATTPRVDKGETHMRTQKTLNDTQYNQILAKVKECVLTAQSYDMMKRRCIEAGLTMMRGRSEVASDVRGVLGNWVENRGDEDWGLEVLNEPRAMKIVCKA